MKKTLLTLCVMILVAMNAMASMKIDSVRYLSTKYGQNWFVTADVTADWWQGSDNNPAADYRTLNGPTFGGSFGVGKWITHNIGLRAMYDVNRANSYIDGRHDNLTYLNFLYGDNPTPDANVYYQTSFMYHNIHGDVIVSPIDFFQGYYNPNRIWTPVLFAGMGAGIVSEHAFALQSVLNNEAINYEFSFDCGLVNNFRLNNYLDLNLSFIWSTQEWHIDSWYNEYGAQSTNNDERPARGDRNYSAGLGLTWYIGGRIYELPYNYEKEMREMSERIKDLEDELAAIPAPIHDTIIQFVNTETELEGEIVSFPFSIFFNKDSYQLMSKRDLVNLREIANVASEKGWKIRLRGSCDSATATAEYNQRLSENRCRKIQMELEDMGIPADQIILAPVGGVKELDPTEFDRRVLIELVKELK